MILYKLEAEVETHQDNSDILPLAVKEESDFIFPDIDTQINSALEVKRDPTESVY